MLLSFEFSAFGSEAIPYPSCYLTSIVDKTLHGPVIASFLCKFYSFLATLEVTNLFSLLLIDIF